jgi:AcrR family transcriptional regulator
MPRPRGDHDKRRREVVDAAWRVIVRDGLDHATIRAVARELGMATKAVTRYFQSKDELLLFALDQIVERQIRISWRSAGDLDSLASLERLLVTALPIREEVRAGWRIWVAFLGYAVGNPLLEREHRRRYDRILRLQLDALRKLVRAGVLDRRRATKLEADRLLAVLDGIGVREAVSPGSIPATRQRALISQAVRSLAG